MSKLRDLDMDLPSPSTSTSAEKVSKGGDEAISARGPHKPNLHGSETASASTLELVRAPGTAPDGGKQLASLGLEKESLSSTGRTNLATISAVVQQLGLTSARKSAILARVMQLRAQQWELDDSQERAERLRETLQAQTQAVHQSMAALEETQEAVKGSQAASFSDIAEKEQKQMRLEVKAENYIAELSNLQAKLKKVGLTNELRHEGLKERHAALSAKQEKIAALRSRLEQFKGMPADMDAAKQLYEDTYAKLQEATSKFEKGLAQL